MVTDPQPWKHDLATEVETLISQESQMILDVIHDLVDRIVIEHVLQATDGNLSQACQLLGISRPTLRTRIRQLKIEEDKV